MVDSPSAPNFTWSTFLSSHANQIFTVTGRPLHGGHRITTQYLWTFSVIYVFVVMEFGTRTIAHWGVTSSPTLDWVKRQIREAVHEPTIGSTCTPTRDALVLRAQVLNPQQRRDLRAIRKTGRHHPQAARFDATKLVSWPLDKSVLGSQ